MSTQPAVTLRARTEDDFEVLYAMSAELDTWEERGPRRPAALTREEYRARIAAAVTDPDGTILFVIEVDGEPVGTVGLFGIDELARHGEMGIALVPSARGRGIGTEAVRQILEFGFVRGNLRRVHLEVIASNAAAIRAYEKVGFVVEGRQREHAWVRGHYEDMVRMGVLRAEWAAGRQLPPE
ncbi:MAG: GNAT family N-acetyltransferase [Actinobacteria bacterium]|nr:GNAT family N-acetyltransferase [Actinomycetota bacterium]